MIITSDGKVHSSIQEANDYLPSTGGIIYLGPGTITLSSRVRLKSNVTLQGSGPATVITVINNFGAAIGINAATGAPGDCLITNTNSNAVGQAAYTVIDENICVRDLILDGNGSNQGRRIHGLLFQYVDGIRVENVDCRSFGQFNSSSHTQTTETLGNKESAGFWFRNCINAGLKTSKQVATDGIIFSFCKRSHCEDIRGSNGTSELVYFANASDCTIKNVYGFNNESSTVLIESTAGFQCRNIVIENLNQNTTLKQDANPTWFASGIAASDVVGLQIKNCTSSLAYGYGISLYNVDDFLIDGCTIYNNNTGNTSSGNANISIGGTSAVPVTRGIIKNCNLYDDRTPELISYGIKITGTSVQGLLIENNKIKNGLLDGVVVSSATNNYISVIGNEIYSTTRHGIYFDTTSNFNTISHNKVYECGQRGIVVEDFKKSKVLYNEVFNNKQGGVTGNGIDFLNTCTDNIVKGNRVYDDQNSPTQANGITESANSDRNAYINNYTVGNVSSGFFGTSGSSLLSTRSKNRDFGAKFAQDYINMTNESGGNLTRGFVVTYRDDADGQDFTTSTTAGDPKSCGLVAETINNTSTGRVQTFGRFTDAKVNGAIALTDLLSLATSNNRLKAAAAGETAIAYPLEANAAGDADIDIFLITPRVI